MSANITIKWDSEKFMKAVDAGLAGVIDGAAEDVLETAVQLCPVGTVTREASGKSALYGKTWSARKPGSLKKSGRVYKFKNSDGIGAYIKFGGVVVDGIDTYYGQIVEAKKRFLRRSLIRHRAKLRSKMRGLF